MGKMVVIFTTIFMTISIVLLTIDLLDPKGGKSLSSFDKTRLEVNSIREQSAGQRTVRTGFMHGK